jgi:hypothetical protein
MNITRASTKHTNLRVSRQIIKMDQVYGAKFEHLSGELNTGADGLSRLEMRDDVPSELLDEIYAIDELNCDVNPDFPAQATNPKLQEMLSKERHKNNFGSLSFGSTKVHTFDGKIWVLETLQSRIIDWYHTNLRHPGVTRTINSLGQTFAWQGIRPQVEAYIKSCDQCQRHKIVGNHNMVSPALRNKDPFEKVHVDCAGPWTVRFQNTIANELIEYKIHVLTMVDACTGWPELALIPIANSKSCANEFDKNWLC